MSEEAPSNAELGRLMKALSEQVQGLIIEIRADRAIVDNTYVRKDVYGTEYTGLQRAIQAVAEDLDDYKEIQKEKEKSWRALRNQVIGGLILIAIPSIITAIVAVNALVKGG